MLHPVSLVGYGLAALWLVTHLSIRLIGPPRHFPPSVQPAILRTMTQTYRLTLILPAGTTVAVIDAPTPTRFIHVVDVDGKQEATLTDEPDAPVTGMHVDTFARVSSAVWFDEEGAKRDALYVLQQQA